VVSINRTTNGNSSKTVWNIMIMTRVGIVNPSADTTEMLDLCLTRAGFAVIPMLGRHPGYRVADLSAFARDERIQVIVFDIATPVVTNWRLLQMMQASDPNLPPVVVTTSRQSLESPASRSGSVVFIGPPYRLELVVREVRRAAYAAHAALCI
jgi:DNA-binding NtrC family response regulator